MASLELNNYKNPHRLFLYAAATAAKSLQSCPLCATPLTAAHQAPPSLGFSRQEHWSGLPFPSPMQESEKWKWSHSVVSDSSRPRGLQPTRLLCPWNFPGKSAGVGCHCLLQCFSLIVYQIRKCHPGGALCMHVTMIRIIYSFISSIRFEMTLG